MADTTPVNIEVNDKIDGSVTASLKAIASQARDADLAVERLRAQLVGIDGSAVSKLTKAVNDQNKAYLDQEAALNKAVAAEAKAQAACSSLEAAQNKTAISSARLTKAELDAEAALNRGIIAEQAAAKASEERAVAQDEANAATARSIELNNALSATFAKQSGLGATPAKHAGAPSGASSSALADETKEMNALGAAQAATTLQGQKFISGLENQVLALNAGKAAVLEAKAAELGMAEQAAPLIASLKAVEAAELEATAAHNGSTASITRESFAIGREGLAGNFSRMAGSITLLAQYLGITTALLTDVGIASVAAAGGFAIAGLAAIKGERDLSNLNNELKLSGNYAGITASEYFDMAKKTSDAFDVTQGSVKSAMDVLIKSGQVGNTEIKELTESSVILGKMTGKSSEEVATGFLKMKDGVVAYGYEFNAQYHLLSAAQLTHVQQLESQGHKAEAAQQLEHDMYVALLNDAQRNIPVVEKLWDDLWVKISNVWESYKTQFRDATPLEHLAEAQLALNNATSVYQGLLKEGRNNEANAFFESTLKWKQADVTVTQNQIAWQDKKAAADRELAVNQQKEIEADQTVLAMDAKLKNSKEQATEAIKKYNDAVKEAAKDPNNKVAQYDLAHLDERDVELMKKYDAAGVSAGKAQAALAFDIKKVNAAIDDQLKITGEGLTKSREEQEYDRIKESLLAKHIDLTKQLYAAENERVKVGVHQREVELTANEAQQEIDKIHAHTVNLKLNNEQQAIENKLLEEQAARVAAGKTPWSDKQLQGMREALVLQQDLNKANPVVNSGREAALSKIFDIAAELKNINQYIDNEKAAFAVIDELRKADVLTAEQAEDAKTQYALAAQQLRFQQAEQFFGDIATMSSLKNKELAAIGKAAAIIQAGISGVQAVMNALAVQPYPLGVALAASAALATAVQIAKLEGMADGGLVYGNGGPREDNIPRMLSAGEYVVNARDTAANFDTLEAINAGYKLPSSATGANDNGSYQSYTSASSQASSVNVSLPKITIHNHGTPQQYRAQSISRDEIVMIATDKAESVVAKRVPTMMGSELGNENSHARKTLQATTNVTPRRRG